MKYLLDTHTLLWFINGDNRLNKRLIECIENYNNEIFISSVSLWEIAVKINIGKLKLRKEYKEFIPKQLEINNIEILNISHTHLIENINLPMHHRDPFDRLIISQALAENLTIITKDGNFKKYKIKLIW